MSQSVRILGVDPGLRNTGWGIIDLDGPRLSWVAHGVIKPKTTLPMSERLSYIIRELNIVIDTHKPDESGIEETFVNKNPKSTLLLGQARGAAMAGLSMAGLTVAEFAATKVKQCVVGTGAADKDQVAFMIKRLLPKAEAMTADAADALAIAITTANHRNVRSFRKSA
ncbi:crossover junction endodeoxyribonuclease RuvC [Hirschia litorea]|uniref:Crossover junction endodeoxyribonuclease RuvC n=1 Tax=Hirschia litorea TaxID=1199156 RepID=A0ABW2IKH3_9PROT